MAKLKSWYDVVDLREDLTKGRPLDASEFAVHLDHIRDGRAHEDYRDPSRFFERTYPTRNLLELSSQVIRRLSGIQVETSAVFNMTTQFGGGKSHALAMLYHLANHGDRAKGWKHVDRMLSRAETTSIPKARVAVFMGTEFDPLTGRGGNGEPVRHTPWGEIAWQLGGQAAFDVVHEHDQKRIAPGGDVIRRFLPDEPVLIMCDEVMNYISRGQQQNVGHGLYDFLHNLSEEARGRDNLVLCISLPSSDSHEMSGSPYVVEQYQKLTKLLDRVSRAIRMSAETEMAEIIRRRLFQWDALPNEAKKVVRAYSDWAVDHSTALVGVQSDTAYQLFESSYPFHPSVLSVFERKWSSLPQFQRTRGILRLLALWVAKVYQDDHLKSRDEPLITLGSAPLEDQTFRDAVFKQLGCDELDIPAMTDIAGATAHATRLDNAGTASQQKSRLHQKVATTIFFESNGGQNRAEATLPEIRMAVGSPDGNLAEVDSALEALTQNCFYINWDNNRYRFGLTPNLNKMLVDRKGSVPVSKIEERIRQTTEELFKDRPKSLQVRFWPRQSNDVPSIPALTVVVLGAETPHGEPSTRQFLDSIVQQCGNSGRTFKSALLFSVPDSSDRVPSTARELLAWEDINDDSASRSRLDELQQQQLRRSLVDARSQFREAVFRSYRHLYLLDPANSLKHIDLGQITSSGAPDGSIIKLILSELRQRAEITEGVGPTKLVRYWPACVEWSTKAVCDAFFSSPKLPRLLDGDVLKRTIADGVSNGLIEYATKDALGRLKLLPLSHGLFDADVEPSDDLYILKAEDARKLREPRRLDKLALKPASASSKTGEQISFSCSGIDQYGDSISVTDVVFSATGGTIDAKGLFTAGDHGGAFTVKALSAGIEAPLAEVRITTHDEQTPTLPSDPVAPSDRFIRWRGNVPSQKWMNFYTKVLSKYATSPDLKIEVSFKVKVDPDQTASKTAETQSSLRELGLEERVDVE